MDVHRPILEIGNLSKSFAGNLALDSFDLSIGSGEVHVLVGENGSGKSTLIKIMSGYHLPDPGGDLRVDGYSLQFGSADHAFRLGCRFVHQDLGLIPSLSVLENLALGAGYPTTLGTIRTQAADSSARESLARVGLEVSVHAKVYALSASQRTGLAVARALRADALHPPKVLVLDEPTATLPTSEVDHLLEMLQAAASSGVAILFVTHHLEEVFRVADIVTVIRDGRKVATAAVEDVDHATLVHLLVGEAVENVNRRRDFPNEVATSKPALNVTQIRSVELNAISFSVAPGEIVGVAGLTGSGRESLLGAIFGSLARESGEVAIDSKKVPARRPDLAIAAGAAYLPADRKVNGGLMTLSATENLTLPNLRPFWKGFRLQKKKEAAETASWFSRLQVRPRSALSAKLGTFSGGNQQKILFGKWLRQAPKALLIDDPTQGVDVGAKAALHQQLLDVSMTGTAVVFSSTDIEELTLLCDRVLVVREGAIVTELVGDAINAKSITESIMSKRQPLIGVNDAKV